MAQGKRIRSLLGLLLMAMPLHAASQAPFDATSLAKLLHEDPRLAKVAADAETYRLQILVGLVEPDGDGRQVLRQVGFRADAEYFYPASSIKLFAAVTALEKLNALRQKTGQPIDENTGLVFHPLFEGETRYDRDPSNIDDRRVTPAQEIRKLFLVSDNPAFNRLYEFVGQDVLNDRLHAVGLESAQIVHRLSIARSVEDNKRSPKIDLYGDGFRVTIPERTSEGRLLKNEVPGLDIGQGVWRDGKVHPGAMDFRIKNRISLTDLQRGLCKVVRPEVDAEGAAFDLSAAQREWLLEVMAQYPRESRNPVYDPEEYPDDWVKFLLPGLVEVVPKDRLRIYNKIGCAYGFSVENAWVVDRETGRSFFLAAALYTNADGILNDDQYEYDTVALPFLAALGEAVAKALWPER